MQHQRQSDGFAALIALALLALVACGLWGAFAGGWHPFGLETQAGAQHVQVSR